MLVEVDRGGDAPADLGDEDRVLERPGGVELGEALQRGFVGIARIGYTPPSS